MLGHQVGVLAQAVAGSLDLDDHGMVEQTVEQRGGDDRAAEDVAPFSADSGASRPSVPR